MTTVELPNRYFQLLGAGAERVRAVLDGAADANLETLEHRLGVVPKGRPNRDRAFIRGAHRQRGAGNAIRKGAAARWAFR